MLTGTPDWIQLPVERYLAVLPTLKQDFFLFLSFFFLHCRASTGHGRSTFEEYESKKG